MKTALVVIAFALIVLPSPVYAKAPVCEVRWTPTPEAFLEKASAKHKELADAPVIGVPKVLKTKVPVYPAKAAREKIGGGVRAIALVEKDGHVSMVNIVETNAGKAFELATVAALLV